MQKKIERWCYGGKSKAFFLSQSALIHQYNTKMMDRLLLVLTIVLGVFALWEGVSWVSTPYLITYVSCFLTFLGMLLLFKAKAKKSLLFTKTYIIACSCVLFVFVCVIGIILEPQSRAIMFIVYLLALPMLFVIPTHHVYGFLLSAVSIFSGLSLHVKAMEYAIMDVAHGITCLLLGLFTSCHILESRIALYAANEQLDQRLQEKEVQLIQSRISIMLTQIQPHFLYNTLTAICALCDVDPKEAQNVTAKFSDYLRHNLESLNHNTPIPFGQELQHTKVYLEIEQKRFGERLRILYDIETTDFLLPSLSMQPIAENAVKHGVTKRGKGGTVTLSTRQRADCYEIIIADDGVGFDTEKSQDQPDLHIGIENVRNRLWAISGATLTIESKLQVGTVVTIRIPKGKSV